MQMTHVFVALYITTLCMFANAATMNVTFENQNITVRDVESKGSKTRMSERWGHVEIIGAGKEYEFIKALFGGDLRCDALNLILAKGNLCEPASTSYAGQYVYVTRGECTFSDKAYYAQRAGALGLIVGNTDQSIMRMPQGYHKVTEVNPEIKIPVVMVRGSAGRAIVKIGQRNNGIVPSVAIVAKRWTIQGTFLTGKCQASFRNQLKLEPSDPVASAKKSIASPVQTFTISDVEMLSSDGGRIHLVGGEEKTSFEFVRGHFGGPPPHGAVRFVAADPIEACGTQKRAVRKNAKGAVIVTKRGGCAFSKKSKIVEEMGGSGLIVIQKVDQPLLEMADGDMNEDELTIFPVMILHESGEILLERINRVENLYGRLSMANYSVGAQWSRLELLREELVGARGREIFETTNKDTIARLLDAHDPSGQSGTGSPERLQYLKKILPSLHDSIEL